MKKTICLLVIFTMTVLCAVQVHAQEKSLYIKVKTGTDRDIKLNSISKITFSGDKMVFSYKDNRMEDISMPTIRNVSFGPFGTGLGELSFPESVISAFPNPTADYITLSNLPEGKCHVEIYSVTGIRIKEVNIESAAQKIDVSELSDGLYILKVDNQIIKFTKK